MALTVVLATAAAVYASQRQEKLYRSSADVFLNTQPLASALTNVQTQAIDPVRQAATQADLARTPAVAGRALQVAGLSDRSPGSLLSASSVEAASNADILTFSVTDHDPAIAERLAEDYATAYTRYRRQLDTGAIVTARNSVEKQLDQLRRSGNESSGVYADLLEKDQELSTLQVLQGSNAALVRSAGTASQVQPRPVRNGLIAAALGILLGVGLTFLRDALNTRARTAAEVEEGLDLPQLARVPEPPRRLRGKADGSRLVMLADPLSPEAEPFRILATNLEFVNLERSARSVMFTSATHGEGKSTTVANLAVAFARIGRRVALVDLDLRKPSLADLFGVRDHIGLTTLALGNARLGDALIPIPLPGPIDASAPLGQGSAEEAGVVEFLPVGPPPPNPAEFVGSAALGEILAQLEARADLLLIDSPPLLDLSDAMTLTARVDALVVVARMPVMRRSTLQELHRVLSSAPTTKLGFVLTGIPAGDVYGAYGYGYQASTEKRREWERTG